MLFRKLTRVLNSEAKFFSATTVRNQVITTYTEEQNKIRKELQVCYLFLLGMISYDLRRIALFTFRKRPGESLLLLTRGLQRLKFLSLELQPIGSQQTGR